MKHTRERGTSMLEMLITVAILGILVGGIAKFFMDAESGVMSSENRADMAAITQQMDKNMRQSLLSCQRLLCDLSQQGAPTGFFDGFYDCIGAGIAASTSFAPSPVAWGVTPQVQSLDNLTLSASVAASMGDLLVFVAASSPLKLSGVAYTLPAVVGTSPTPTVVPTAAVPLTEVTLDRYQFVEIYLTQESKNLPGGLSPALHLVEWRSRPYVSYQQLIKMPVGAQLTATVQALAAKGYDYAFDLSANDPDSAFHRLIMGAGGVVGVSWTTTAQWTTATVTAFPEHSWAYVEQFINVQDPNPDPLKPKGRINRDNFSGGVASFPSKYSIAYNSVNPTLNPGNKVLQLQGGMQGTISLPIYALPATNTASAFPAGFEVGVYGGALKREVWIRTVIMAISGAYPEDLRQKIFRAAEGGVSVAVRNPD